MVAITLLMMAIIMGPTEDLTAILAESRFEALTRVRPYLPNALNTLTILAASAAAVAILILIIISRRSSIEKQIRQTQRSSHNSAKPRTEYKRDFIEVVLVESNSLRQLALHDGAVDSPFLVRIVANGFEAIDAAVKSKPDLVIAQVEGSQINGFEVCRRIKKLLPDMLVVLRSDSPLRPDDPNVKACGADGVISGLVFNINWYADGIEEMVKEHRRVTSRLHVFLSHASEDKVEVRRLYERLRQLPIDVWYDEINLLPGQDWKREIESALSRMHVVLVCLTAHANQKTGFVQEEIALTLDLAEQYSPGTIFVIPARLSPCDIPDRLARWQWVDLYESSGFERLTNALRTRAISVGIVWPL